MLGRPLAGGGCAASNGIGFHVQLHVLSCESMRRKTLILGLCQAGKIKAMQHGGGHVWAPGMFLSGAAQPPSPGRLIQCRQHVGTPMCVRHRAAAGAPRIPCCSIWPTKPQAQVTFHPPFPELVATGYNSVSYCHCFCLSLLPLNAQYRTGPQQNLCCIERIKSHFPLALVSQAGFHLLPA